MKKSRSILFALALGAVALQSCKDDEKPVFQVSEPSLESSNYTGTGTLQLLYSVDNGATFSPTLPKDLNNGTKVLVKLSNGTEDLSSDEFSFDWSGSTPAPSNATAAVAEFTVGGKNLSIDVTVDEIWALVASHRKNGKFYELNPATGAKTEVFTLTYGDASLNEIRAFVYHPKRKQFFASVSTYANGDRAGFLYSVNPSTRQATRINENDGENGHEVWDAIVNWVVAPDDSLLAIGDFNDEGNGFVKFGTDGKRAAKTKEAEACCGLGMVKDGDGLLLANGWDTSDGEVILENFSITGERGNAKSITNFENFPPESNVSDHWLPIKAMANDKAGNLFALLFDESTEITYFVKIDRTGNGKVTYISTIGDQNSNQYNSLTLIPKHSY